MERMQRTVVWAAVFFFAFLFAGETFAAVRDGYRRGGVRRAVPDHVVAYAALDALESDSGWGRFVVRDDLLPSGDERTVRVSVFGLDANAEYVIHADGVEVGTVVTDRRGDASLKLKTRGRSSEDVPNDLPPANEIVAASVHDAWQTTVLEGEFTVVREHITDPTVHSENIRLEDETGGDAKGMAAVCRKESGAQGFATMAAGLEPGLTYSIEVDATVVGIVTADEEGQAGLELHVPADENPLPDALQPVDNLRSVRWFQGDLLVLTGVFTGDSDTENRCDELEGWFGGLTDDGFLLRKGDHEVEIVVTDDTEFEGFGDLSQLEDGDWLEVKACKDGELLIAGSVELEEHERECKELHGAFIESTENGFVMRIGGPDTGADTEIVVTDETEFEGFDKLGELEEGDRLEVEGCRDGEFFVAESVELEEPERECGSVRGEVVTMTDSGFVLRAGDDSIEIFVTEETRFVGFNHLEDIDDGDLVEVKGCFDDGLLVVTLVALLKDDDCVGVRGVVTDRMIRGFVLKVGDDFVEVAVTNETRFKEFETFDDLDGGEVVAVGGCFDGEVLVAAWIMLLEDDDCVEARGLVVEPATLGFWLQVGDDLVKVVVTNETHFREFETLDDLDGGEVVAVEGCFDGEVLVAAWIMLLEDNDEPEWWKVDGRVVDLFEEGGFALSADGEVIKVIVTEETELEGYENAGQIAEGDIVFAEGPSDGEILFAKRLVLIEHGD